MNILYINYIDNLKLESGSSVRPTHMLSAFVESGNNIIVLSGNQNKKDRKYRAFKIRKLILKGDVDICYIESPAYPIMNYYDRRLLYDLKKKGVPTGYFYRDFYRLFPEQFPRRKGLMGRIKDYALDFLQYLTDKAIENCDIVYFPSIEATEFFKYNDMRALPPACQQKFESDKTINKVGIYVGGISSHYNISPLLEAYSRLNTEDPEYRLILVCREKEWKKFDSNHKNAQWLKVYHVSGERLAPLYNEASIAFVMPDPQFSYNDFAVSVKIFEYVSYGLPVIAVQCKALKRILEENNFGITGPSTSDFFEQSIKNIISNKTNYRDMRLKMIDSLQTKNMWSHRVKTIVNDLCEKKQRNEG